ncbi:MAG: sigma-54 dependent transcriptional regulator [Planctomycetota bacterium]
MTTRLLVADDDASIRESLAERFEARGYAVTCAADGGEALLALRRGVDVALLDLRMPVRSGQEVLEAARAEGCTASIVVLTAHGDVDAAIRAMKAGAYDFVQKPFEAQQLEVTVARAAERAALLRRSAAGAPAPEPVYADPATVRVMETAERAAAANSTVLLLGESGVGKEIVARRIHERSARAAEPFVAVNCAALTESLLESELFGHEKGAFTGANERRIGRLEAAHGGTLFLDEIGDTSSALQVKLLRVLQERRFERVGGSNAVDVDLRLVAATNRDLRAAVAEGGFREDLYYRLAVVVIEIPPLRERALDVLPLAEAFLARLAAEMKRPAPELSVPARDALRAHTWPGNVRELRNAIERALVLSDGGAILLEDLPPEVQRGGGGAASGDGFHDRVERFRRQVLEETLAAHGGHQTRAAEALGLQRSYFARLIKKYGVV